MRQPTVGADLRVRPEEVAWTDWHDQKAGEGAGVKGCEGYDD
jgi:hypothetical protein